MSAAPRYAFITLEPGFTMRDVFFKLAEFGDVKLLSRASEVVNLVADLVRNMEATAESVSVLPLISAVRPVRYTKRCLPSGMAESQPSAVKRPAIDNQHSMMPQPLPRPPPGFSSQPTVKLPSHPILASLNSVQKQYPFEGEGLVEKEMIGEIKTEDDARFAMEPLEGMKEEFDPDHSVEGMEEPSNLSDDAAAMHDSSNNTMYNDRPQYQKEIQPIENPNRRGKPSQARCGVCRKWVKITSTYARLIAHVFMHAKEDRYECPVQECVYSNKSETSVRLHCNATHGYRIDPVDTEKNKKTIVKTWKVDKCTWAPRCFPGLFEPSPDGELYMKIDDKKMLCEAANSL